MPAAIIVDKVSKKFLIGSARYSSLRDLVARPVRRLLGRKAESETERTREFWALKDVSFEVEKGTTLGIIGPNGAGKSTLLKLISRVSQPTKGRIATHGRVSALIEVGAGFHPELTGRENVYLNGSILGMTRKEIAKKFDAIVDFSGIEEFIDTPVKYYSSGMYARLGFSVAAHVNPDILLVDEVLSVGDYAFELKCLARMNEITAGGATTIFVSHNLPAVCRICRQALFLKGGEIAAQGSLEKAVQAYTASGGKTFLAEKDAELEPLKRPGDGKARLLSCELQDMSGRPVSMISTGAEFAITCRVSFYEQVSSPTIGILISNESGVYVFSTNTALQNVDVGVISANSVVQFRFKGSMALVNGVYTIAVGVKDRTLEVCFDAQESAARFSVVSNNRCGGIVGLCNSVEVSIEDAHRQRTLLSKSKA